MQPARCHLVPQLHNLLLNYDNDINPLNQLWLHSYYRPLFSRKNASRTWLGHSRGKKVSIVVQVVGSFVIKNEEWLWTISLLCLGKKGVNGSFGWILWLCQAAYAETFREWRAQYVTWPLSFGWLTSLPISSLHFLSLLQLSINSLTSITLAPWSTSFSRR